jgi:hypothetical protein
MDHIHARLEALEQQTLTLARRLRWWRGLTCGMLVLGLLTWALPSGKSADAQSRSQGDRIEALHDTLSTLQDKLVHITSATTADGLNEVVISGANLRIVNGLRATRTTNGVGNLIIGYNEPRLPGRPPPGGPPSDPNNRTGSHNIIVGSGHNFSSFGGLVVGNSNEISGDFAAVSGGNLNTASGVLAAVSGGRNRMAEGDFDWVAGPLFADE